MEELIKRIQGKMLVLYGAGVLGNQIAEICDKNYVNYVFADKNAISKQGTDGRTYILPEQILEQYPDANVVIASNMYENEIMKNLREMGIEETRILTYSDFFLEDNRYKRAEDIFDWDVMDERAKKYSDWITGDVKSVADYGAGKMAIRKYLNPKVKYFPIDYKTYDDTTIVCNLNDEKKYPEIQADVSICSCVLEYLNGADKLLRHVCKNTNSKLIICYPFADDNWRTIKQRRFDALVNDFTFQYIQEIVREYGFVLLEKRAGIGKTAPYCFFEKE